MDRFSCSPRTKSHISYLGNDRRLAGKAVVVVAGRSKACHTYPKKEVEIPILSLAWSDCGTSHVPTHGACYLARRFVQVRCRDRRVAGAVVNSHFRKN